MSTILVAEDEARIAAFVEKGLRTAGFDVVVVHDGRAAYETASAGGVDLLVLDLGLPKLDGSAVLARLRAAGSAVPVIVLTARTGVDHTVASLEGGADDHMVKPFRVEELVARIRLRLREERRSDVVPLRRYGDLALDTTTRRVTVGGRVVELSAREFLLLELLLRSAGDVVTRERALAEVWGYSFDPGTNVVDVYIGYLRRKVGTGRIATVRGVGYRLLDRPFR